MGGLFSNLAERSLAWTRVATGLGDEGDWDTVRDTSRRSWRALRDAGTWAAVLVAMPFAPALGWALHRSAQTIRRGGSPLDASRAALRGYGEALTIGGALAGAAGIPGANGASVIGGGLQKAATSPTATEANHEQAALQATAGGSSSRPPTEAQKRANARAISAWNDYVVAWGYDPQDENDAEEIEVLARRAMMDLEAGRRPQMPLQSPTLTLAAPRIIGWEADKVAQSNPWDRSFMPGRTRDQVADQVRRTLVALIQVESGGDPYAVSPSGKHFGLLQMGYDRAADVGIDAEDLLGQPRDAVEAWLMSLQRSQNVHQWIPMLIAISWKGGTGTLKKFLRLVDQGRTPQTALMEAAPESWNLPEYVRRFTEAFK